MLNILGLAVVHPVSMNTFNIFECIKLLNALYLKRFLFPDGIPFAFRNPILIDPPFSFGCKFIILYSKSLTWRFEISYPKIFII